MRESPFDFDFQFHWLTLVLYPETPGVCEKKDLVYETREILKKWIRGIELENMKHGASGYDNLELWQGVRLSYGGLVQNDTVCISISGDHVGSWNLGELRGFIKDLRDTGTRIKCTRLDLAYDVDPEELTIEEVYSEVKIENYKSRVHRDHVSAYFQVHGDEKTLIFGSRSSSRYFRIYNRRGYVRFELEMKGDAAELVGLMMLGEDVLSNYSKVVAWAVGVLKDFIQFKAEFWKIFDGFEKAGFKVSCFQADSMDRSKRNIEERMGTVLCALVSVLGREWLEEQLFLSSFKAEDKVKKWGYAGEVSPINDFGRLYVGQYN
jgi:DNA relaxase NicK